MLQDKSVRGCGDDAWSPPAYAHEQKYNDTAGTGERDACLVKTVANVLESNANEPLRAVPRPSQEVMRFSGRVS